MMEISRGAERKPNGRVETKALMGQRRPSERQSCVRCPARVMTERTRVPPIGVRTTRMKMKRPRSEMRERP